MDKLVSEWSRINIDTIAIPDRLRALREDGIEDLVASFNMAGQLNPITVRPQKGGGYVLIAGLRRLEAAKHCGWKSIRCAVLYDIDADKAELIEIDENLMRAELTPAERAMHIERRKAIFEKAHPETKHGGDRKSAKARKSSGQVGHGRFTKETARKTRQSERSIRRDATRGENIAVLADIVDTSLDQGAELDALAKLPEPEQRKLAKRAKAGEQVSARPVKAKKKPTSTTPIKAAMPEAKPAVVTVSAAMLPISAVIPTEAPISTLIRIADLARDCRGLLAHPAQNADEIRKKLSEIIKLSDARASGAKSNVKLNPKLFLRAMALEDGNDAPARSIGNDVNTEQSAEERRAFYVASAAGVSHG
jgi:ParB-like chromosome segregation protein Spo0J